jgi:hypothetical protein
VTVLRAWPILFSLNTLDAILTLFIVGGDMSLELNSLLSWMSPRDLLFLKLLIINPIIVLIGRSHDRWLWPVTVVYAVTVGIQSLVLSGVA